MPDDRSRAVKHYFRDITVFGRLVINDLLNIFKGYVKRNNTFSVGHGLGYGHEHLTAVHIHIRVNEHEIALVPHSFLVPRTLVDHIVRLAYLTLAVINITAYVGIKLCGLLIYGFYKRLVKLHHKVKYLFLRLPAHNVFVKCRFRDGYRGDALRQERIDCVGRTFCRYPTYTDHIFVDGPQKHNIIYNYHSNNENDYYHRKQCLSLALMFKYILERYLVVFHRILSPEM